MVRSSTISFTLALAVAGTLCAVIPASAQVYYARPVPNPLSFLPFDESYGTSPSFEIVPRADGTAPAVRVVERCQYPEGWNVTDFGRDLNGVPNGLDHTCPVRGRVRSRY